MIRKISGKPQSTTVKHLTKNQIETTTRKDIAEVLAETFSENSSLKNSKSTIYFLQKQIRETKTQF